MNRRSLLKRLTAAPLVLAAPPLAAVAPPGPAPAPDPVAADLARLPDPRDDIVGFLDALDADPALRARLAGLAVPVFPSVTAADAREAFTTDAVEPLVGGERGG